MQVIILSGGLGTRLRPYTYNVPKSMILIKGKPFLEYQIDLLKKNGLKNILICGGFLSEQIRDYFNDGDKWGVNISYSFEKNLLGTGGALKNAKSYLEDNFLLLNGDTFLDINYQDAINNFWEVKKTAMMVVYKNSPKIMSNNVEINKKKEVINYNKRKECEANCVDAGVQIFRKKMIDLISSDRKVSLEEEIFPVLIQKEELSAYPTAQTFYDIGTFERLEKIKRIL
jgi:D-glycero-alpha-D-manno-heptose 1-phosphate guanylyltransferase